MNSAASIPEAPAVETPEQAMSYNDWKGQSIYKWVDTDSLSGKMSNFFVGMGDRAKRDYQTYLDNLNIRNEQKATQSARAWDEYMANTQYQRAFKDLEAAGVNPYMIVNSGSTPGTATGSASKASYSKSSLADTKSNTKGRDLALIVLAIAKIAAMVA